MSALLCSVCVLRQIRSFNSASWTCYLLVPCRTLTSHLICASPTGRKYEAALAHNSAGGEAHRIQIVTEDWLWQCLRQWRRLDEALFRVEGAVEEVGETSGGKEAAGDHVEDAQVKAAAAAAVNIQEGEEEEKCFTQSQHGSSVCSKPANTTASETAPEPSPQTSRPLAPPSPPARPAPVLPPSSPSPSAVPVSVTHPAPLPLSDHVFLLGGGSSAKHRAARELIERLGGAVQTAYHSTCTHLLLWRVERTEKCLCFCAAGKVSHSLA